MRYAKILSHRFDCRNRARTRHRPSRFEACSVPFRHPKAGPEQERKQEANPWPERRSETGAGATYPEPYPEPVGTWFFERNTWAEHNLGNPSRSWEAVAETDAIVGCSEFFECDSASQLRVSGFRPGSGIGSGWRLLLRTRGPQGNVARRGPRHALLDRVSEELESLKTKTWGPFPPENPVLYSLLRPSDDRVPGE